MIFLSDLDKTLIFSYKRLSADNYCVERKDGKELSYITHNAKELFGEVVRKALFIPVTTRSVEQYNRICFPDGFSPKYAVTDNGGNLLINGEVSREWREEYEDIINSCGEEFEYCSEYLRRCGEVYFEVRLVDGVFLFTKSSAPEKTLSELKRRVVSPKVDIFSNGEKIYVVPKAVNKADALRRIKRMMNGERVIAAGDSLFDIGMLKEADCAIVKNGELSGMLLNENQIAETDGDDPDYVLKSVMSLL